MNGLIFKPVCVIRALHYSQLSAKMSKPRVLVTNPEVQQKAIDLLKERYKYTFVLYFNH